MTTRKIDISALPKTMVTSIFILIALMITGFFYIVLKLQPKIDQIQSIQIPLLERSAVAVRINQTISLKLENIAYSNSEVLRQEFLFDREIYQQNVQDIFNAFKGVVGFDFESVELHRQKAEAIENQVLQLIDAGNKSAALNLLKGEAYSQKVGAVTDSIQSFTEKISYDLDMQVAQIYNELKITLVLIAVGTLLLVIFISLFMRGYLSNLKLRKESQALLEEERVKAAQAAKLASLGEMAGGIAHEINSPLAIIKGNAELMVMLSENNNLDEEKLIEKTNIIMNTTDRIAEIIKAMKRLSRNEDSPCEDQFSLNEVVRDAASICKEKFRTEGIDLKIKFLESDLNISGRHGEISQVLVNLLNNSYDAIFELGEKWVSIELEKTNDQRVRMTVSDSGSGIPKEIQQEILTPFFTTKEVGKGTGMGLSISNSLVQKNGGTLSYLPDRSNTTFEICFSISDEVGAPLKLAS